MENENTVLAKWEELKVLVASIELDVHKNANGNSAAGVRARGGLRTLKQLASSIVKITVDRDKIKKAKK